MKSIAFFSCVLGVLTVLIMLTTSGCMLSEDSAFTQMASSPNSDINTTVYWVTNGSGLEFKVSPHGNDINALRDAIHVMISRMYPLLISPQIIVKRTHSDNSTPEGDALSPRDALCSPGTTYWFSVPSEVWCSKDSTHRATSPAKVAGYLPVKNGNKYYICPADDDSRRLEAPEGETHNGAKLRLREARPTPNQQWRAIQWGSVWEFESVAAPGMSIDMKGSTKELCNLWQHQTNNLNQLWHVEAFNDDGAVVLRSVATKDVLTVFGYGISLLTAPQQRIPDEVFRFFPAE